MNHVLLRARNPTSKPGQGELWHDGMFPHMHPIAGPWVLLGNPFLLQRLHRNLILRGLPTGSDVSTHATSGRSNTGGTDPAFCASPALV